MAGKSKSFSKIARDTSEIGSDMACVCVALQLGENGWKNLLALQTVLRLEQFIGFFSSKNKVFGEI